jgi:hypothetical protein
VQLKSLLGDVADALGARGELFVDAKITEGKAALLVPFWY